MKFVSLEDVLAGYDLQLPSLKVLYPDANLFDVMLLQPEGNIGGGDNFVGSVDRANSQQKTMNFLAHAHEANVSLAVTPEYSTSWIVLNEISQKGLLPEDGNIWVLGLEGISRESFLQNVENFKKNHVVHHEKLSKSTYDLIDVVVYMFSSLTKTGERKSVFLFQLKTKPLGDSPHFFERDRLILGTEIYVLSGSSPNTLRLVTFICADTLGMTETQVDEIVSQTLIIHIQLNPQPRNFIYSEYRGFFFKHGNESAIICSNWARNVVCEGKNWNNISGTGIYLANQEMDLSDARVSSNHIKGLYFTSWRAINVAAYFFTYEEGIFHFKCTKSWQHYGVFQQRARTGPVMHEFYKFQKNDLVTSRPDDGFIQLIDSIDPGLSMLKDVYSNPVDVERLVCISLGLSKKPGWNLVKENPLFKIDQREILHRISFAQDNHEDAISFREMLIGKFSVLVSILSSNTFPLQISNLQTDYEISFDDRVPVFNLRNASGAKALVIYVGERPSSRALEEIYANSVLLLSNSKESIYSVVIWYKDQHGNVKFHPEEVVHEINSDPQQTPFDIDRS